MKIESTPFNPLLLEDGVTALITEDLLSWIELGYPDWEFTFMPSDLFDLTYRLARELGVVEESTITSNGAVTTAIDTNREEAADYWNEGTFWLLRDSGLSNAAPEGEYSIISDWNATTKTFTLRNTLSAATGLGDIYAVAGRRYPLNVLIQAINSALTDLGRVPYTDTTTITLESNRTEYTLPVGASEDLREVYLQTDTTTNDNQWQLLYNWEVQVTPTGSGETLVLPEVLSSGYVLKLVYQGIHPDLRVATDQLSELIPVERIIYPAVVTCMRWYRKRIRGRSPDMDNEIEKYEQLSRDIVVRKPIRQPRKTGRINLVPDRIRIVNNDNYL